MGRSSVFSAAILIALFATGCGSISTVTVSTAARRDVPLRIAVMNFAWDPTRAGPDEVTENRPGVLIADAVSQRLTEIPEFTVVPRQIVRQVTYGRLKAGPTLAELVRQGKMSEVAKLLDADAVVIGDVENDDAWVGWVRQSQSIAFSCRCVDGRTGQTLWTLAGEKMSGPYGRVNPNATLNQILSDAIPKLRRGLAG